MPTVNVLFLCSRNRLRSPTAEQIFASWPGIEVASAGLSSDAEVPLDGEQVQWAQLIFVMEKGHRSKLQKQFRRHLRAQKIICLGIPDDFDYMQPELVSLLKMRVVPFLPS
jgi:predicted protein tyrosine phosphatase